MKGTPYGIGYSDITLEIHSYWISKCPWRFHFFFHFLQFHLFSLLEIGSILSDRIWPEDSEWSSRRTTLNFPSFLRKLETIPRVRRVGVIGVRGWGGVGWRFGGRLDRFLAVMLTLEDWSYYCVRLYTESVFSFFNFEWYHFNSRL